MKILIYLSILFVFFSCNKKANSLLVTREKKLIVKSMRDTANNKPNSKWIQYKRQPVGYISTVAPYVDCYFIIESGKFFYYKSSKLVYIDYFKIGKNNRISFEIHSSDQLIFNKDSTEAILKRYNCEGEYEYFKKTELNS